MKLKLFISDSIKDLESQISDWQKKESTIIISANITTVQMTANNIGTAPIMVSKQWVERTAVVIYTPLNP